MQDKPELLTKQEIADLLKVSVHVINKWMAEGCPYMKLGVKLVRFEYEQVLNWLSEKLPRSASK